MIVGAVLAASIGHLADAVVIIVVVFVNAIIGYIQEGKAEQALRRDPAA